MSGQRVVACIVNRGDRFLVCQRRSDKRHGGLWEFPGGKVEAGESDMAAAKRELAEELRVELKAAASPRFEIADDGSDYRVAFLPVEIRGDPVCVEHSAFAWATLPELVELPLAPSDAAYVQFHLSLIAGSEE